MEGEDAGVDSQVAEGLPESDCCIGHCELASRRPGESWLPGVECWVYGQHVLIQNHWACEWVICWLEHHRAAHVVLLEVLCTLYK